MEFHYSMIKLDEEYCVIVEDDSGKELFTIKVESGDDAIDKDRVRDYIFFEFDRLKFIC